MTRAERAPLDLPPRGLNRMQAAAHIGVSVTIFERLVADGLMPPAREIYSRRVWDVQELERAFDELPHANPWAAGGDGSNPSKSGASSPVTDFT